MNNHQELIQRLQQEYTWQRITIGESGADTYHLHAINKPSVYLKISATNLSSSLANESRILEWLQEKLPVPKVLAFFTEDDKEHLMMTAIHGVNMAELVDDTHKEAMVKLLADGLKQIHTIPVDNCPFNRTIQQEIKLIKERVKNNLIDESDFDEIRMGRKASDLLAELLSKIPPTEDLVFTHGDYCLPNIIIDDQWAISGFVDLSRAGIGDRYRDLALACRSIEYNWGEEWVQLFIDNYGLQTIDAEKIEFYQLVDEFF